MVSTRRTLILGATGAIGSTLARTLRERGQQVVLGGRNEEKLRRLCDDLDAPSVRFEALADGSIEAAMADAAADGLTGVVNCVGSILLRPAHRTDDEAWRHTLDLNLTSAFRVVRAAQASLGDGGSVVLLSSAAAAIGIANHEAIAAAKAGIEGLTRAAAATYAGRGLRINAVAPGLVDTPLAAAITGNEAVLKASVAMHPLGRIGEPGEVAAAIAWLLSSEASWVTGQVFRVDGGLGTVLSRRR